MKKSIAFICFVILISCYSVIYSQKTTIGIYSGVNLSDIHGQNNYGKWGSKPGPVQGFNLGYSFNKTFGLQTGMSYSTIYYEHKTISYGPIYEDLHYITSPPYYYYGNEKMDFSFLRIPVLLTVSIPSALQFDLRAGVFFSFLKDYSLPYYYYYDSGISKKDKKGFGYIFSTGVSYPFTDNIKATFNAAYMAGPKKFPEYTEYKHGSSEFTLGFAYTGFLKNKKHPVTTKPLTDTLTSNLTVTYQAGINISRNASRTYKGIYQPLTGSSFGFILDYDFGYNTSIQTGLSFERKGYSLSDSSDLFYRYVRSAHTMYDVDTRVMIDYMEIPLLVNFYLGYSKTVFLNTGPYMDILLNARCAGTELSESRYGGGYNLTKTVVNDDMEKLIHDTDFGWIIGGGVTLPVFKKYKIDLALRYSTGFNDVYNHTENEDYTYRSYGRTFIQNGTVSFLIGIRLPSYEY
jgi:opacity protein-like surface antigen